jgi:hypothetical protein
MSLLMMRRPGRNYGRNTPQAMTSVRGTSSLGAATRRLVSIRSSSRRRWLPDPRSANLNLEESPPARGWRTLSIIERRMPDAGCRMGQRAGLPPLIGSSEGASHRRLPAQTTYQSENRQRAVDSDPYAPHMSKLNNPAGRLHELLSAFRDNAGPSQTINGAWCAALQVEQSELLPRLGQVASLLDQVRIAVERSERKELREAHAQFANSWAVPIFGHGRNPSGDQSSGLVDQGALVALGSLAMVFELVAPDGQIPDEELGITVKADLNELLEELVADTELPGELRAAISARVHDILWAIDHVKIVGPDGVQAAIERLVGQLAIFTVEDAAPRNAGLFRRTMQVAAFAWSAFRNVGDTQQALEAWRSVFELMPPN